MLVYVWCKVKDIGKEKNKRFSILKLKKIVNFNFNISFRIQTLIKVIYIYNKDYTFY